MPTQTYTPAATWSNSSSYQQNGDVTDATVAQLTGEDALDNIAYLTGSNTRSQVSRIQTCTDLAALKAIAAADRRDLDFCVLDTSTGERLYKFDSAGAGTGDDYAIVTPNAGTGRWHLVGAATKTPTLRRAIFAVSMDAVTAGGAAVARDFANGRVSFNGSTHTFRCQFQGFNAGDVISEIEVCGRTNVGGNPTIDAVFYLYEADDGDTAPTITTLGTASIAAAQPNTATQVNGAPLPITIPAGPDRDIIVVEITCTAAAPDTGYLYWVALNGTRTYITE